MGDRNQDCSYSSLLTASSQSSFPISLLWEWQSTLSDIWLFSGSQNAASLSPLPSCSACLKVLSLLGFLCTYPCALIGSALPTWYSTTMCERQSHLCLCASITRRLSTADYPTHTQQSLRTWDVRHKCISKSRNMHSVKLRPMLYHCEQQISMSTKAKWSSTTSAHPPKTPRLISPSLRLV